MRLNHRCLEEQGQEGAREQDDDEAVKRNLAKQERPVVGEDLATELLDGDTDLGAVKMCIRDSMYVTGSVLLPFFALMTMLIAVPTGVKIFNWIGTMWRGSITFETPMLWALGFLVSFVFGGLTGVILASPALDFHLSDTYFVVAHLSLIHI